MRVNPNFTADILQNLYVSQNQEQTTIQQMSSGRLINMPSDNPAGAAQLVENQVQQEQNDQFQQNTTAIEGLMHSADSTLSSVVESLNQAVSLGVEGGNTTKSPAELQSIAQEVQGIQQQMVQLANTSYEGNYIFSGTLTKTEPYTLNPSSPDGVTYNGNTGTNTVTIANGNNVQTNVPGSQIFQGAGGDVFGALQQLVTALQNGDYSGVESATTALGGSLSYLSQQRVFYGNVLNQLTDNQNYLQQEQVTLQTNANSIDGVDMAKAATDLSQEQVTQSATLAALAKIVPMSLLNYLK